MDVNWETIYSDWEGVVAALKLAYDTDSLFAMSESGELIPSNRPMIEDIHECKVYRRPRFHFYLDRFTGENETDSPRIVRVGVGNRIRIIGK